MKKGLLVLFFVIIAIVGAVLIYLGLAKQNPLPTGNTDPNPSSTGDTTQNTLPAQYVDALNTIKTSLAQMSNNPSYQYSDISVLFALEPNKNITNYSYSLIDLNGDKQKELLIYSNDAEWGDIIFDMYTIVNNTLVHVLSSQDRDTYTINANNTITRKASNSAFESSVAYYTLSNEGKLVLIESITYESSMDATKPTTTYTLLDSNNASSSITEQQANQIEQKYVAAKITRIPLDK